MSRPSIALIGRRGAGKTRVSRYLVEEHGYRRHSWADGVRVIAAMAYGDRFVSTDPEEYAAAKAATYEIRTEYGVERVTGTWILQHIGTEALRDSVDKDFWIKAGIKTIERAGQFATTMDASWVNDDTRFVNEVEALRDRGFLIVGLIASHQVRLERLMDRGESREAAEAALGHPSESLEPRIADTLIDAELPLVDVFRRIDVIVKAQIDWPRSVSFSGPGMVVPHG